MSPTKTIFNKDKELRSQWAAVAASDWFQRVLMFARSEFIESNVTQEQLSGAKQFERILVTIIDPDYTPPEPIRSPINHAIDNPQSTARKPQPKKD
jgi:hypothetical protein